MHLFFCVKRVRILNAGRGLERVFNHLLDEHPIDGINGTLLEHHIDGTPYPVDGILLKHPINGLLCFIGLQHDNFQSPNFQPPSY